MENTQKSKWFLIIGISIPVIVILFIAILAYSPGSKVEPQYDFLYYFRDYSKGYCYDGNVYAVSKGKIKIAENIGPKGSECLYDIETDPPRIYRYDAKRGGAFQITFEDAVELKLDNNSMSPDGLFISRGNYYNAGIFEIFGGVRRNYNAINLSDSMGNMKEINIGSSNYYDLMFIGWVLN